MRRRQILLDEASDRILTGLAEPLGGNKSRAVRELDQIEQANAAVLRQQKERSEKGFREGRFTTWEEVKSRLRL